MRLYETLKLLGAVAHVIIKEVRLNMSSEMQ